MSSSMSTPSFSSYQTHSSSDSSIRASILNVCIQLGALDDNSRIADWMFNDPTDDELDDYFDDVGLSTEDYDDRKRSIRFTLDAQQQRPPKEDLNHASSSSSPSSSISSRLAAKLGFRTKWKNRGGGGEEGEESGGIRIDPRTRSNSHGHDNDGDGNHHRARRNRNLLRKNSQENGLSQLKEEEEEWEEIATPTTKMEFEHNIFLGGRFSAARKLTVKPLSDYPPPPPAGRGTREEGLSVFSSTPRPALYRRQES